MDQMPGSLKDLYKLCFVFEEERLKEAQAGAPSNGPETLQK